MGVLQYKKTNWIWTLPVLLLLASCAVTSSAGNKMLRSNAFEKQMLQPGIVLLDVRTPEEYAAGHLPNAVLYDFNAGVFQQALPTLDSNKTYLLYCRSAKRSDKAASMMKAAGIKQVLQLKNGIQAWKGAIVQ
ncbi:rhodanese-like domain-containing protein [Phnomibacter sp. MR]|uniref:rhodanese-like domain-containing protein n=1 Tax=Phnomibacter sp. MR TaxID=3042318 RepID=UPI003A805128